MTIEKKLDPDSQFGATTKIAHPFQLVCLIVGMNRWDLQCWLAPRIAFFSIVTGGNYLSKLKSIPT